MIQKMDLVKLVFKLNSMFSVTIGVVKKTKLQNDSVIIMDVWFSLGC